MAQTIYFQKVIEKKTTHLVFDEDHSKKCEGLLTEQEL